MRNKNVTAVLALFLGVFGIHRFYLGQYERGALYIIYPIVVLLLFFWITGSIEIAREQLSVDFTAEIVYPLLPFLVIPVFDTFWFATRSHEAFNARYNKKRISWPAEILTALGYLLLSGLLVYWLFDKFLAQHKADVDVVPDYTVTATQLAAEFESEDATAKYENKVLEVSGVIIGESFGSGDANRLLLLEGTGGYSVKCTFQADEQEAVKVLMLGQAIRVKGRFAESLLGEVQLEDCVLLEAGPVPVHDTLDFQDV
jgi:TM2 domain-containing membrane protein YozV